MFGIDVSSCVAFCFIILISSNLFPFRPSFISGNKKKSHTVKRGENVEVAVFVGFHFWLRNVAHAETCAMKRYRVVDWPVT